MKTSCKSDVQFCRYKLFKSVAPAGRPLIKEVLEGVRTLAFRLLLLIFWKGNLEYCDVASYHGHLSIMLQKQELESSSGTGLHKVSWRSAGACCYVGGVGNSAHSHCERVRTSNWNRNRCLMNAAMHRTHHGYHESSIRSKIINCIHWKMTQK